MINKNNKHNRRWFLATAPLAMSFPFIRPGFLEKCQNERILKSRNTTGVADLRKIRSLLSDREESHRWLLTGDSITHGAKHTHGYRSYPEIFQERLRWELGRPRDVAINTGMSGHTTKNILDDFEWRVTQFKPVMVSIMIGTNDCSKPEMSEARYRSNLNTIVEKIRDLDAVPVLHTPNPIIVEKAPERKTLPDYIPIIQNIAKIQDTLLVDNYAHWVEVAEQASQETIFHEWLNDPLHPNQTGHQEIAMLMFKTLDIFDPKDSTCGGGYYEGEH